MFTRLKRIANNVNNLNQELIFINIISVDNIQRYILDLNRINQIFEDGITSFGDPLPVYSEATEGFNLDKASTISDETGRTITKQKKAGERYNLLDTGEMFRSFDVVIDGGGFRIEADTFRQYTDRQGNVIDIDYDETYKILGLTDESKAELSQRILPMVIREVRQILFS